MRKAEKLISDTIVLSETEVLDIQVWKVPKTRKYPEGIRYSYNYRLFNGKQWLDIIRWDNYHGAKPHMDIKDPETGDMRKEPDVFRKPDEIVDTLFKMRENLKAKWKV